MAYNPPIGSIYHLYHLYIAFWGVICYLPPFRGTRNMNIIMILYCSSFWICIDCSMQSICNYSAAFAAMLNHVSHGQNERRPISAQSTCTKHCRIGPLQKRQLPSASPHQLWLCMIEAVLFPVIAGEVAETDVCHRYFCQIQLIETRTGMRITQREAICRKSVPARKRAIFVYKGCQ